MCASQALCALVRQRQSKDYLKFSTLLCTGNVWCYVCLQSFELRLKSGEPKVFCTSSLASVYQLILHDDVHGFCSRAVAQCLGIRLQPELLVVRVALHLSHVSEGLALAGLDLFGRASSGRLDGCSSLDVDRNREPSSSRAF